jgi:hypothetical protein
MIPRGKYLGEWLGEGPASEAEHFIKCAAVFDHEGPLPHPPQDQTQ